jgi:hypothetical protein
MPIGNIVAAQLTGAPANTMGTFAPAQVLGNGSVSYAPVTATAQGVTTNISKCGLTVSDGDMLPDSYKVQIYSTGLQCVVIAPMQDKTSFRVTGEWEPFIPNVMQGVINQASQMLFKQALISRYTSRRIWKGTSPISITLNLSFNSVNDTYNNVVEPVLRLLQMAAPSEAGTLSKFLPVLTPPGPSPFQTDDPTQNNSPVSGSVAMADFANWEQGIQNTIARTAPVQGARNWLNSGDNISILIGKYLTFNNVVVKEVQPTFDTAIDINGYPIRATVSVTFETYEIPTKETLGPVPNSSTARTMQQIFNTHP